MKLFSNTLLKSIAVLVAASIVSADPVLPTDDEFYTPPSGYESKQPGEVIKSREVPNPLQGLTNVNTAYQLMFRTTNTDGDAMAAVTTVVVPQNGVTDRLVTYNVAEDSAYIGCAPSYSMQTDNADGSIQMIIDAGYIANVPDHQGPNSAFTAGKLEGQISLDSIRAAKSLEEVDSANVKLTMWGYSGGSIPTGWGAQLAKTYAPDLKFSAVAMGGVVSDLFNVLDNCNKGLTAGFVPTSVWGLSTEYAKFKDLVDNGLNEVTAEYFKKPLSQCTTGNLISFVFQNIFNYFKDGEAIMDDPEVKSILESLKMGGDTPDMPVYVYQSASDETVPVDGVDTAVDQFCANGATLAYHRFDTGSHISTAEDNADAVFKFLQDAMEGNAGISGCSTVTASGKAAANTNAVFASKEDQVRAYADAWNKQFGGS